MTLPTLIREEVASAASSIQFGDGTIGMPTNAPEGFDGTFGRIMLTMHNIVLSNSTFLEIGVGEGGSIPAGVQFNYMARGNDGNSPATTRTLNGLTQSEIIMMPIATDPAVNQHPLSAIVWVRIGVSGSIFTQIYGRGAYFNASGTGEEAYFWFRGARNVAADLHGLDIRPSAGTFDGTIRMYGWSP